ncbi:hypothetical protein HY214_01235 [Candidatus Roizmanbacteria bacterium]|nr:hypothetical protein [Candidatus Roizmanbacteria bacterium]
MRFLTKHFPLLTVGLTAGAVFILYVFRINLSTDTIILFLANKIFLGKWLAKGVLPLYNPNIFTGVPFAFDIGLGNLHPYNIFFLLPYPFSLALVTGISTFVFLAGFFLLFNEIAKNNRIALFLAYVLFFSGSGFIRYSNPTIMLVIVHYGLFMWSLKYLDRKQKWLIPLVLGVLMTLGGHFQFVLFGYILGLIFGLFYLKIPLKKIALFYIILFILVSWYFLLAMPIVLESTRLTIRKEYVAIGPVRPFQFLELLFPFLLGYVRNGSFWNVGPTSVLLISPLVFFITVLLSLKRQMTKGIIPIFLLLLVSATGFINLPFLRGAGQIFVVIHILMCLEIAKNGQYILANFKVLKINKIYLLFPLLCLGAGLMLYSRLFTRVFTVLYYAVKHRGPNLFFDAATITATGRLIGANFFLLMTLSVIVYIAATKKKFLFPILLVYVVVEGLVVNYAHTYFVPSKVIPTSVILPKNIDSKLYRVQTAADVIPYYGFHNYMSAILLRPPFSKENTFFTEKEQANFEYLQSIFKLIPSSWSTVVGIKAVQGYNTFVPVKVASYLGRPSIDYRDVYKDIIRVNPLFGEIDKGSHINAIETSRVTLYDKRWSDLSVKYFISPSRLDKYKLLANDGRFFYVNPNAVPIYGLYVGSSVIPAVSFYEDPNKARFNLSAPDVGKTFKAIQSPDGFIVYVNGKKIPVKKDTLSLSFPVTAAGTVEIIYSPLEDLRELLTKKSIVGEILR